MAIKLGQYGRMVVVGGEGGRGGLTRCGRGLLHRRRTVAPTFHGRTRAVRQVRAPGLFHLFFFFSSSSSSSSSSFSFFSFSSSSSSSCPSPSTLLCFFFLVWRRRRRRWFKGGHRCARCCANHRATATAATAATTTTAAAAVSFPFSFLAAKTRGRGVGAGGKNGVYRVFLKQIYSPGFTEGFLAFHASFWFLPEKERARAPCRWGVPRTRFDFRGR